MRVADPLGTLFGFGFQSVFSERIIKKQSQEGVDSKEAIVEGVNQMLTILGVAHLILCFMLVTFMKEKPHLPPSKSAMVERVQRQSSVKDDLRTLFGDSNFCKFLLIHTIMVAQFAGVGKTFIVLLEPFGFNATQASIYGVILSITGVVLSVVLGFQLDKSPKYQ
jgi:hypothetical protein